MSNSHYLRGGRPRAKGDKAMEKKRILLGLINKDGYRQSNTVYDGRGISPTVLTFQSGTENIKTVKKYVKKSD